jgi:hypothetical protein
VGNAKLQLRTAYIAMGAVLGGVWMISSGQSPLMHVIRSLVAVIVAMLLLRRRLAKRAPARAPQISFASVLGAKLVLLLLAAWAEWALERENVAHPDMIVAGGLFVVVALGGPLAHRFFVRRGGTDRV